ncbi:DUF294 nucleotidyltransferase-like domain-containing protein [Ferdinandcohnia sp. Marseille-Q9671]
MEQVYEVVKDHPFFKGASKKEVTELLTSCQIKTFVQSDLLLDADEQREALLLLLSGVAEVFVGSKENPEVLEVLAPGDLIGLSGIAGLFGENLQDTEYRVGVVATEGVQCLIIPNKVVEKRLQDSAFHQYLLTQLAVRLKEIYHSLAEQVTIAKKEQTNGLFVRRVQDMMTKNIISVDSAATICQAATIMSDHRTSSVLVMENKMLKGIITDSDLVTRVIVKGKDPDDLVTDIMTENPLTISRDMYCYEAISIFVLQGVKHLPVVENGRAIGIITLSDVLRKNNDNMMKVIKSIEFATEDNLPSIKLAIYAVIDALLQDDVPIYKVLDSITKLYDRLVKRCIEMAIEELSRKEGLLPPVAFCFYQMGSAGREEQFLLTDQDHFLVYENSNENAVHYFSKLGEKIVDLLEKAGYARCRGNMMASNSAWRGSVETWLGRIRTWSVKATNQNLLLAQNFFSYRLLYGDEMLHHLFETKLLNEMRNAKILLYRLHEQEHQIPSLDQPIRALFRLDKKSIDIKKEILFPYHHCLQIISIDYGIISGTPFERIDKLVVKKAFSANFAKDVKAAISDVMRFYVKQRWNQYTNKEQLTSILTFSHVTTKEKEELIVSVNVLRQLQTLVNAHFTI